MVDFNTNNIKNLHFMEQLKIDIFNAFEFVKECIIIDKGDCISVDCDVMGEGPCKHSQISLVQSYVVGWMTGYKRGNSK